MHKTHNKPHGSPGEINPLPHNLLLETAPTETPDATGNKLSTFSLPRAIAVVLGITVISALLLFQDDFNAWLEGNKEDKTDVVQQSPAAQSIDSLATEQVEDASTVSETSTDAAAASANTPISSTEDLPADDPAVILAKMYGNKEPGNETNTETDAAENVIASGAETNTSSPSESAANQEPTPAAPIDESAESPATIEAVDKTVVEASRPAVAITPAKIPTAPTPVTTTPPAAATPPQPAFQGIPTDLPGQRADWIQQQNPEHYTLQLVAGNNLKTLRAFIQRHSPTEPIAVYRSSRKDKPWFGLIHGVFASKQQAIDASNRLSKTLGRQKPWVRKLGPLQKELRETALTP